jgi:dTDP-4-dehydrorhamnose 3,5-epimerase
MGNDWVRQAIPGLYTVGQPFFADSRGSFHKILCDQPVEVKPLIFDEIYWSSSVSGVTRGMHLQIPPFHGRKLVFVSLGAVRDFVIDLRQGSPTYLQTWEAKLTPESSGILIPAGCAHGFVVEHGPAVLVYAQEGAYNKDFDTGVNILSIGSLGLVPDSVNSDRDNQLPSLLEFNSPFTFDESEFPDWNLEL